MKTLIYAIAAGLSLCACARGGDRPTDSVAGSFLTMYPHAWDVEWEFEAGQYVADFREGLYDKESWFLSDGTWIRTKTELPLYEVPKNVIDAALGSLGLGWYVESVDHFLCKDAPTEYYLLDCEKVGTREETKLRVGPDGTLLGTTTPVVTPGQGTTGGQSGTGMGTGTGTGGQTGGETGGQTGGQTGGAQGGQTGGSQGGSTGAFAAAKATFATMFPGVTVVEWEMEYGKVNAEFWHEGREKEAWFLTDGSWESTKTELMVNDVPQAVSAAALAKTGSGWYIEDADHYLTSGTPAEYYILELEQRGTSREAKLRIAPDGTIL